ncbi:hypothetical protein [Halalkalibacter flavus]|jgi:Ca2+/Na+ antiporter|uniref:hypothetical protein n=1 Tax=Halalkalibacter flavus TaxID=3090668 RepID=UPI002FC62488
MERLHKSCCTGNDKRVERRKLEVNEEVVTLIFFVILVSMVLLMAVFDTIIYGMSFLESIIHIYPFELGTRRTIVTAAAVVGLLVAVYIDYKEKKNQKGQQSVNK